METNNFTLVMAPPGWGKTSLILNLLENSPEDRLWIFLSPLRALSEEFYDRVNGDFKTWFFGSSAEGESKMCSSFLPKLIILSPEVLQSRWLEKLKEKRNVGIIIDEIHLFFKWGETFRPKLLEAFYEVLNLDFNITGLSATVDESLRVELKNLIQGNGGKYEELDFGNYEFMNAPSRELSYGRNERHRINRLFIRLVMSKKRGRFLLFCKTREEVNFWLEFFQRKKVSAIGAVGGEVDHFRNQLKSHPNVRVIVSTSVLSHGVNLPRIDFLFINYFVEDFGLWIQMASRAGRRGEKFNLISCRDFKGITKFKNKLKLSLMDYYFQFDTFFERIAG